MRTATWPLWKVGLVVMAFALALMTCDIHTAIGTPGNPPCPYHDHPYGADVMWTGETEAQDGVLLYRYRCNLDRYFWSRYAPGTYE